MKALDNFYKEIRELTDGNAKITAEMKSVVLFRAAFEVGAAEMGIEKTMYIVSKLMTTTLGIMAGEQGSSFEDVLEELDTSDMSEH
jgi:NurA-like 5'-3' nuclease